MQPEKKKTGPKPKPMIVSSLRIPPDAHKQVRRFADANKMSFNSAAVALIERGLAGGNRND